MMKILSLLAAALLGISLTACEDSSAENQEETTTQRLHTQEITIPESILLDEHNLKITATELREEGLFGPELILLIENNSETDLTFQSKNAAVNGFSVKSMMYATIPAGEKGATTLSFSKHDLNLCEIDKISDMVFSFHIYDAGEGTPFLDSSPIQVKTSLSDTYSDIQEDKGTVVYQENDIKIIVKELKENHSTLGPCIVVSLENNSNRNIVVRTADVWVNGTQAIGRLSAEVTAGKSAVDTISFMTTELEDIGVSRIENADLSFQIIDADTWDTLFTTEVSSVSF